MNSLTSAQSKNKTQIYYFLFIIGLGLGMSGLSMGMFVPLVLPILCMFYLRSVNEAVLFLLPLSLHSFISVSESGYLALSLIIILGLILISYFLKANILTLLRMAVPVCAFVYMMLFFGDVVTSFAVLIFEMIIMNEIVKDWHWMKQKFKLPSAVYGIVVLAIGCLLYNYMPLTPALFLTASFIFICSGCEPIICFLCYGLIALFMPNALPLTSFIVIFVLSLLRNQKKTMLLVFAFILLSSDITLALLSSYAIYLILFLLLSKEGTPFQEEKQRSLLEHNRKALMHRQLNHFSMIFENLAEYYETVSALESSLLESMGKALEYTAKKCKEEDSECETYKHQILNILEGYKIDCEECELEISDDGRVSLLLSLNDFRKSEVKEVLLPLLNHILPTTMELVEDVYRFHPIQRNTYQFISGAPIQIDAYADSIKHDTVCGDTFSIFRHARSVYCMISDGMGSGYEAGKISSSISNIFQRMIASDIPELDAIFCINKLLQSESYATMDVLSFDRYQKTVMICKSAACPTYLIRNNELYAINGHSLPIGIITEIEVDHVKVHVEKNDWFLMSSDGVFMDEITHWIQNKKDGSAKEEVENLMQELSLRIREDDTTILLAKVLS